MRAQKFICDISQEQENIMKKFLSILLVLTLAVFAMASTVSAEATAGTVYDIHDYFGEEETAPFSFVKLKHADGTTTDVAAETGTGVICQYDPKEYTAYKVSGNCALVRTDSTDTTINPRMGSGKIWQAFTSDTNIAIIFTAPVAGEYTFDMGATRWWDNNTTAGGTPEQQPCDITVKYGDQTKTTKLGNGTLSGSVTGTATLAAGETMMLYIDPLGVGAGDNVTIDKLTVTLTSVAAAPSTPSAPATADGIVAAIALLAVAGTAIVIAKKVR